MRPYYTDKIILMGRRGGPMWPPAGECTQALPYSARHSHLVEVLHCLLIGCGLGWMGYRKEMGFKDA